VPAVVPLGYSVASWCLKTPEHVRFGATAAQNRFGKEARNEMPTFAYNQELTCGGQTLASEPRLCREEGAEGQWQPGSFEALVFPHLQLLDKWVKSRAPKSLSSDDVLQQTLVLAWKHMSSLRSEASLRSWLCAIALNVIRGNLRSLRSSRIVYLDSVMDSLLDLRDGQPSALESIERQQAVETLHRKIATLPKPYRLVVELCDLKGLSTEDAMSHLALSRPALKSRHSRARRMLLKLLGEEAGFGLSPSVLLQNSQTRRLGSEPLGGEAMTR
jgi:RNA polymerase sigma factor (sigma-70 family)